jgi:DNA-binding response OmpR family regulator
VKIVTTSDAKICPEIILFELNASIRRSIARYIQDTFTVKVVEVVTLEEAIAAHAHGRAELMILDPLSANGDPLLFLNHLEKIGTPLPSIGLLALTGSTPQAYLKKLGVTEVIHKPFFLQSLGALVRKMLLDHKLDTSVIEIAQIGSKKLQLDLKTRTVSCDSCDGIPFSTLTKTEMRLLITLARARGGVVSRDELASAAESKVTVSDRKTDVHMTSLRKKLEAISPGGFVISSVRHKGYSLNSSQQP